MSNNNLKFVIQVNDINSFILNPNKIIGYFGENTFAILQEYVLDNLHSLDGGPSISNLEIIKFKYNSDLDNGSLRLKFQINKRYCCSDTESCANDYLDFNFDLIGSRMTLEAEYFDWTLNN
ncbi:hypothetical protein [Sphingobacterium bovistauri]|uniref:Uncharacterized protein n=1 Tax=Sphingobacterium bovistauri TaxID=2781959 RepID=A0ABS7Z9G0_9SPHI|nr:hypothetical protein [Sphingobacterium bovistauri]MCA5006816.1 hypothetical protein [Sphingobacterium bovistauri]